MQADYWQKNWREGRIGFHEQAINPLLTAHADWFAKPGRVLVPLCGKSLDLWWLAEQGHDVVGIELTTEAALEFFAEASVTPQIEKFGAHARYLHGNVTFWQGDFFTLDADRLGRFDYWYDRAALIALPSGMREEYVRHLKGLLRRDARGLTVTLDYDQDAMAGPPFSVSVSDLTRYFSDARVAELESNADALATNPKFLQRGVQSLRETVWKIER